MTPASPESPEPASGVVVSVRYVFDEPFRGAEDITTHDDMHTSWGVDNPAPDEPCGITWQGDPMMIVAQGLIMHEQQQVRLGVPNLAAHPMMRAVMVRARLEYMRASEVSATCAAATGGAPHDALVGWLTKAVADLAQRIEVAPSPGWYKQTSESPVQPDLALADTIDARVKGAKSETDKIRKPTKKDPWWLWCSSADGTLPGVVALARAGWKHVVKPGLDREAEDRRKRGAPFRFPQPVGHGMTTSRTATIKSRHRAADGLWTSWTSCVTLAIPGAQLALPLPMDVEVDAGGTLQSVLTGGLLRTYLATWALWADRRSLLVDGGFAWDEEAVIRRYLQKTGKVSGHLRAEVRADLARLCEFRVVKAGGWSVQDGSEPLIRAYREDSSGQIVYKHAGVITLFLNQNFAQVPRNVLSLNPDDVPLALGLTTVTRRLASDMLAKGNRHEGTLRELADACGVDVAGGLRKYGPAAFWSRTLASLKRVAGDGQVGTVEQLDGNASTGEARVRLTMSEEMVAAYRPLQRRATELAAAPVGAKLPRRAKGKTAPQG